MSIKNIARLVWLIPVLILGVIVYKTTSVEFKTSFKVSELQREIQRHFSAIKVEGGTQLEALSLKEDGSELAVTLTLRGKHLGNEVRATAVVHGEPGYAAVRKHMLFSPKRIELKELTTIGQSSSSVPISVNSRDKPKGIDNELGRVISSAFATIKAHELEQDLSEYAWLNYAVVQGDQVELSWNKVKTTATTLFVIVAISILIAIMIWCPEILFFWAIIS